MLRYFIELSYRGANYQGWQVQQKAPTVQAEVNKALSTLLQQDTACAGASRTDTGVHARQNFAQFDTKKEIPMDFLHRMNGLLPRDVVINGIFSVSREANVRFDAIERTYEYILYLKKDPFLEELGYFYPYKQLNIGLMQDAANLLLEHQDYTAFCKARTQVKTKICQVKEAQWNHLKEDRLVFNITANRFLRGMVRGLVGSMMKVGSMEYNIKLFEKIIKKKDRSKVDFSPPGNGLYLMAIKYPYKLKPLLHAG